MEDSLVLLHLPEMDIHQVNQVVQDQVAMVIPLAVLVRDLQEAMADILLQMAKGHQQAMVIPLVARMDSVLLVVMAIHQEALQMVSVLLVVMATHQEALQMGSDPLEMVILQDLMVVKDLREDLKQLHLLKKVIQMKGHQYLFLFQMKVHKGLEVVQEEISLRLQERADLRFLVNSHKDLMKVIQEKGPQVLNFPVEARVHLKVIKMEVRDQAQVVKDPRMEVIQVSCCK